MSCFRRLLLLLIPLLSVLVLPYEAGRASESEKPVERNYVLAPPAPGKQTAEEAASKSSGCISCHLQSDAPSMHASPAVRLGCADCHGALSA
jgi:cytochrome c553